MKKDDFQTTIICLLGAICLILIIALAGAYSALNGLKIPDVSGLEGRVNVLISRFEGLLNKVPIDDMLNRCDRAQCFDRGLEWLTENTDNKTIRG
jgi:hypothetical protein